MSLANGFNRMDAGSSLRRCTNNVMTALNVLARSQRIWPSRSGAYSLPTMVIGVCVAVAVFLLLQNGNIFLCDEVEGNVLDGNPVELWIHCDQIDAARFVQLDITQVAVRFVPDHVR